MAYRRLGGVARALGPAIDAAAAGQEILDFLAMLDGLKPLLLIGRGLDEPRWLAGVLGVAKSLDLAIVEGPTWAARPPADVPGWYAAHVAARMTAGRAWTVTASGTVARELRALGPGGPPDIATEARLLGYPVCCVTAHYDRADGWARLTLTVLARRAGGDTEKMRGLLRDGAVIEPEGAEECALHAEATGFRPCAFTSWNLCAACAAEPDSPSATLSARYLALADATDPQLAALLAPRYGPV